MPRLTKQTDKKSVSKSARHNSQFDRYSSLQATDDEKTKLERSLNSIKKELGLQRKEREFR